MPSNPNYELVDCYLIIYKHPLPCGTVFSLLWDDAGEQFRHMMEFTRMPDLPYSEWCSGGPGAGGGVVVEGREVMRPWDLSWATLHDPRL